MDKIRKYPKLLEILEISKNKSLVAGQINSGVLTKDLGGRNYYRLFYISTLVIQMKSIRNSKMRQKKAD